MSGGAPLPPSQMPLQRVHEIEFQVFKEKQIKDYAVCLIDQAKSYENGEPVRGGINDLRMGSTDFEFRCGTCGLKHPECPGHFGYVELAEPLFNIGLFDIVLTALKCVCKTCGALLMDTAQSTDMKKLQYLTGVNRLRMAAKMCGRVCKERDSGKGEPIGCGKAQPRVGRSQTLYPGLHIKVTEEEEDAIWYADKIWEIFDRVSDADARALGFQPELCHPRDLILTVLPVPPPQVRPAVAFGAAKSDDELTHQIMAILQHNNILRKNKESGNKADIDRARALLQEHVATYFNNASTFYKPAKVGDTKKLKSLTERLKGKYGRLRGNLMGKRVDFSARTVITGDPNIDVDEVGVPFSVAMTLTFPERVNAVNKKRLTETVRRPTYPSANYIFHENGTVRKLALMRDRSKLTLSIGDVVERHVINGDVVLFNRQPTLHRMSMMGHRVRVLNYNTFRLNLSCTTPYNADFDGDEMNLHVPQSLLTKAELIEMMMVPKNFVSPNKSAPCMGIVQDSLLGSYRLTDKDTFLDKYFIQSVALWLNLWELPIPAILKPRPLWTGKQIFSLILPEVNHPATPHSKPPFPHNDSDIMIQRGQLLVGAIQKKHVGAAQGSLIHVIFNERGSDEVAKFINGVQRITTFFNITFAFSVGIQDTVADADTLGQINKVLEQTRDKVSKIFVEARNHQLTRKAGMTLLQSFEAEVNAALNGCREDAGKKALSNVLRTNSFKVMIQAGSKGTELNICQIAVFVGQQNVAGARIPFGFRRRTLPHFMLDDYGETSRGMANRGYVAGLKPHEFYFHTMAGREGLIDTAVKTADTGYLQRKLMKALEDVHASYDGTVRNANQELIQLFYGEDGLDGARIEGDQAFQLIGLSNKEMTDLYRYEYSEDGSFSGYIGGSYMDMQVKEELVSDPHNAVVLQREMDQLMRDRESVRTMMELTAPVKLNLPVNVSRLIQNARTTMGKRSQVSNLSPITIIDMVKKLQEDLVQLFPSHNKGPHGTFTNILSQQRVERALTLFNIHLRQMLGSKRVLAEYKLNDKAFEYLLKEIRTKYQQAFVQPGENIGAIAAQSCGEPATQMTLNTFHNAGISSKNVTLGVPRLLELLNVSKNQRNASLSISLTAPWQQREQAQHAQHFVEYCTLASITTTVQILYDPDVENTVVVEDQPTIDDELGVQDADDEEVEQTPPSPFIARLVLNDAIFNDKQLNMRDVKSALREVTNDYIIQANMKSDGQRFIRLRPKTYAGEDSVPKLMREVTDLLSQVHLLGVVGVKKTLLKEVKPYTVDKETGKLTAGKVWMIETEGTALKRIFVGVLDGAGENVVDFHTTISNKVPEVAQVLGIEAARQVLLNELRNAYLAYGLNINYRHYSILVDTMCQRGYLMAVSRTGINRSEMSGPLMRCSFEETVKVLMAAAAFGETDHVRGVSANLVLGNQPRLGTGLFDLILDMTALEGAVTQEQAIAPGKEVTKYHGIHSILEGDEESVRYRQGAEATPYVNEASAFMREQGQASSMAPYANVTSALYGSRPLDASVVHNSLAHPSTQRLNSNLMMSGIPSSASYSVMASASVYQPVSVSEMGSAVAHPSGHYSEAFSEASSFHLESTALPAFNSVQSSPQYVGAFTQGVPMPGPAVSQPYDPSSRGLNSTSYVSMNSPAYEGQTGIQVPDRTSGLASRASAPYNPAAASEQTPSNEFSPTEEQEES